MTDDVSDLRHQAREKIAEERASLGDLEDDFILKCCETGEAGDGKLFINLFGDYFCFDHAAGLWHFFQEHFWSECELDEPVAACERLIEVYGEMGKKAAWRRMAAAKAGNEKEEKQAKYIEDTAFKKIASLQRRAHRQNVLALAAAGRESLGISGNEWDK